MDARGRRAPPKASVDGHKCRRDGKADEAVRNRAYRLKVVVAKSRLKAKGK
jgi:hypothetical protein